MPAPPKPVDPPNPEIDPDEAAASSTDSSAAEPGGFFSQPGPGFDADAAAGEPAPEPVPGAVLDALWEEETVRGLLTAQGATLHSLAGKGDADWIYTQQELRAISGPLTRILNRYPVTQAAAGTGDEIALLLGLGGYVTRSVKERRAIIAAQQDEEGEEVRVAGPVFPEQASESLVDADVGAFSPVGE